MSVRVVAIFIAVLAASGACVPDDVHVPGEAKELRLAVKLAALTPAERGGIGSFALTMRRGDDVAAELPLVFDSTEPEVMEAGLQHFGGKALLNSANLEDGEGPGSRLDRVFTLARGTSSSGVDCLAQALPFFMSGRADRSILISLR